MRTFPGGECPPKGVREWRAEGSCKFGNAGGSMQATVKAGVWTEALFTGRGMAPGAGIEALRRQQALGVSLA